MAASTETAPDPVAQIAAILETEDRAGDGAASVRNAQGQYSERPRGPRAEAKALEGNVPADQPEATEPEATEPEATEAPTDPEATEQEDSAEGEAPEEGESPEEEADGDDSGISSLAELAEALDTESEQLAAHLTIEGNDGEPVPLADALAAYRNAPEAEAQASEYARLSTELQAEGQQRTERLDGELNRAVALTRELVEELQGKQPDWDRLRDEDPDLYMEKRREWVRRDELVQKAMGQLNASSEERSRHEAEELKSLGDRETATLLRKIPAWRDEKVASQAIHEMRGYLETMGFGACLLYTSPSPRDQRGTPQAGAA